MPTQRCTQNRMIRFHSHQHLRQRRPASRLLTASAGNLQTDKKAARRQQRDVIEIASPVMTADRALPDRLPREYASHRSRSPQNRSPFRSAQRFTRRRRREPMRAGLLAFTLDQMASNVLSCSAPPARYVRRTNKRRDLRRNRARSGRRGTDRSTPPPRAIWRRRPETVTVGIGLRNSTHPDHAADAGRFGPRSTAPGSRLALSAVPATISVPTAGAERARSVGVPASTRHACAAALAARADRTQRSRRPTRASTAPRSFLQ